MTRIEKAIVAAIQTSGFSNYEIANRLDVSRSLVGRWANTGKISVEKLGALCRLLDIDANELLHSFPSSDHELSTLQQEVIQLVRHLPENDHHLLLATKKMLS